MGRGWRVALVLVITAVVLGAGPVGPGGTGGASRPHLDTYSAGFDRAQFTTTIDHPYLPLRPGTRWVYEGHSEDGEHERTTIEVTSATRRVMGVDCVVVRDTTTVDGEVIQEAFDWYAQDDRGNVWYFGENTMEYRNGHGRPDPGDWEAGVRGARPGIVMKAGARVGDLYRQVYNPLESEEVGEVLSLDETTVGRFGSYRAMKVRDYTPDEPGVVEHRYFVEGVGMVLAVTVRGGSASSELVEMTRA